MWKSRIHRFAAEKRARQGRRGSSNSLSTIAKSLLSDSVLDAIRKDIRTRTKYNSHAGDLAEVIKAEVLRPGLLD